jgi:hypothetical protein
MVQGRPYGLHIPRTLEARPVANIEPDAVKRKAPPEPDSALIARVEPLPPAPHPRLHEQVGAAVRSRSEVVGGLYSRVTLSGL